jgi:hypothetical protein
MSFSKVGDKSFGDVFTEQMWDQWVRDNLNSGVMRPIGNTTLGASASSITFSSIPTDFTHLILIGQGRNDTGTSGASVRINGDTGANYDWVRLYRANSTYTTDSNLAQTRLNLIGVPNSTSPASTFGAFMVIFPHYTSTKKKSLVAIDGYKHQNTTGSHFTGIVSGGWRSTAVINSISYQADSNLVAGSSATLYGIGSAS